VHPAFNANGSKLHQVANFVSQTVPAKLKALALCDGKACATRYRAHDIRRRPPAAFAQHGFCARSKRRSGIRSGMFSTQGKSSKATSPLRPGPHGLQYDGKRLSTILPRKRWIRTANDSYFTAMSYPQGTSVMAPASIHDASWGIVSAVHAAPFTHRGRTCRNGRRGPFGRP